MIEVLHKDKRFSLESHQPSMTGLDVVIQLKIPRIAVGIKINNQVQDLRMPIGDVQQLEVVDAASKDGLEVLRHSCAHLLAHAVKELHPEVQVTIGPVIENGFFYDFSKKEGFKIEELEVIEKRMREIAARKLPIKREVWSSSKAVEFFKSQGEHYKCEIIQDLGEKEVSVYSHGTEFTDLCRGPHVMSIDQIPAFKLTSVAGAYWRGNEKNEMLSRIYGTAFASEKDLKAHLDAIEEAKKRDHRKIGVELGLFSFHPEAPAAPFFHPPGAFVYTEIQKFLRELNLVNGFEDVVSPLILSEQLWKTSGHYDNYRENMYFTTIDEHGFAVKPMNCPGHCLIYHTGKHSYRDLPVRYAEFGRVHRHERSGVTAGLFRVRSFVQDDAHIYCTEDQIQDEILRVLGMIDKVYTAFGFEYRVELSTRPEKRQGSDALWDKAEGALEAALKKAGRSYQINPGDGAFYGPKIDCHLKDSIGRSHQCGTIQLDFSMPGRFGLEYVGSDNTAHIPVMVHRAIVGSLERFMGILIEHYAGKFPFWLAPTQVAVLTISEEAKAFGDELFAVLKERNMRVVLDDSAEKLGAKVRKFQNLKVPYMIVIGAREAAEKKVSIRFRDNSQENGLSLDALFEKFKQEANPYMSLRS